MNTNNLSRDTTMLGIKLKGWVALAIVFMLALGTASLFINSSPRYDETGFAYRADQEEQLKRQIDELNVEANAYIAAYTGELTKLEAQREIAKTNKDNLRVEITETSFH